MKRWIFGCFAVLCAVQVHAHDMSVPDGPRVIDVSAATLTDERYAALERQRGNDESIEWVIPAEFDRAALNNDVIEAFLFDTNVVIKRSERYFEQDESLADSRRTRWRGEVIVPGNSEVSNHMGLRNVTFDISPGGYVIGKIRINEVVYTLSGGKSGSYTLTKQDLSKLNKDANDVFDPDTDLPTSGFGENPSWFPGVPSPIRPQPVFTADVLVAFSTQAVHGDVVWFSELVHTAVRDAQDAFFDSGINLYLNVLAFAQPGYNDATITQTLSDLRKGHNGPLWLAHAARETEGADVIIMVVEGSASWPCGGVHNIGSTRETAYLVVRRGCFDYRALAHELAHLMGAHHNVESIGSQPSKYPFGHGYYQDGLPGMLAGWSTIMSYESACLGYCPRIFYFSDPHALHYGQPRGSATSDNVQAILLNARALSNYYTRNYGGSSNHALPMYTPQETRWLYD